MIAQTHIPQRSNVLEDKTIQAICSIVPIDRRFEWFSSKSVELMKSYNNLNKLFIDACSENLTYKGNQRRTEFVLHCPIANINWRIECKQQKTPEGTIARITNELDRVIKLHEDKLCLILEGGFRYPIVMKQIADEILKRGLENRVWFGSLNEFEQLLRLKLAA
jgi:hypothetical protein